jgi:glycosyltransferase involved in cell wall biosynthesis
MYFNEFTASFLRNGSRVIALCPEPAAAKENLLQTAHAPEVLDHVHFARLSGGKRSFFNGRFEGDPARTFTRWKRAADALADAESMSGWQADLVYFPYLDSYLRFLPFPQVPDLILQRPWSGLYLRNHHYGESKSLVKSLRMMAKGDALMRSKLCRGIGVLDERFIPEMKKLTHKPVIAYPDVTEGHLSKKPFPLALEIQRKARGRRIVGMIGLERRKGLLTLLRTASLARAADMPIYFVCAGSFHPTEYSEEELAEIKTIVAGVQSGSIDNLHFDPAAGRIPDEGDFNFLFSCFDVAWAAYEGFQGSSGTLSKAALFEIPCIATAGECIGQRIERYHMGLTIPEATPHHALEALPRLVDLRDMNGNPLSPNYALYREDHSQARLDRILADLVAGE